MQRPTTEPFLASSLWHQWHKENFSTPYRPSDYPVQEDWESVARKFNLEVNDLIFSNFYTNNSDEVNYYLFHYGGFKELSPSGNNIRFHRFANPGIIYIPPPETTTIDFTAEEVCVWMPKGIDRFIRTLDSIARRIKGEPGKRIRKLVQVVKRVGHPACLDLWYYNPINVRKFVALNTTPKEIQDMTKATNGTLPFDGESGLYSQRGPEEITRGKWRIHPFRLLFEKYECGDWTVSVLERELELIDDWMMEGWKALTEFEFRTHSGGITAYDPMAPVFHDHVIRLTKDQKHLYWAFGS